MIIETELTLNDYQQAAARTGGDMGDGLYMEDREGQKNRSRIRTARLNPEAKEFMIQAGLLEANGHYYTRNVAERLTK